VGLQWGDEAKGKIVDLLADEHDIVVRYQGGANAGHTVVVGGKTHKMSLVPTGILHPNVTAVIANGVVIDPATLLKEIDGLQQNGVHVGGNLLISDRAHVIFPYHRKEEEAVETGHAAIGTTMRGIGPCYRDKYGRGGFQVADLYCPEYFWPRLEAMIAHKNAYLSAVLPGGFQPFDAAALYREYLTYAEQLRPMVTDTGEYLHGALAAGKRLLFEGAQGALLDVDHGSFPFVTGSNSSAAGVWSGSGVPARRIDRFIGVLKAYTTRVGRGPFPTELLDATGDLIRNTGREFGTVTGRPRRCGWFDAVLVRNTARLCGVDALAVMLLDVLSELDELSICVEYVCQGKRTTRPPANCDQFAACQPVYRTMPGWKRDISNARRLGDLPAAARQYLDTISELVGLPISIVSVGPDRAQTIRATD
jgi:adenylosuccinate synthase